MESDTWRTITSTKKDLNEIDKSDITSFLDSHRKPETIDPLHK